MKKVAFCIVLLMTSLSGAFSQKTVQLNYALNGFKEIDASSAFSIYVEKGSEQSIVVVADEHIADDVKVTVSKGVLSFYLNGKNAGRIKTLKAHVVMPELKGVRLTGSCDLMSDDTFVTEKFTASLAGSSDLKINIRADQVEVKATGSSDVVMNTETMGLKVDAAGSSDVVVTGKAMALSVGCTGSSSVEMSELQASDATISLMGGSDMTGNVQGGKADIIVAGSSELILAVEVAELKVSAAGASDVKLSGKVDTFTSSCLGSSKIYALDLLATNATLEVMGASSVKIHAEKTLNVNAMGASTVIYKGDPVLTSSSVGASTVKKQ